MQEVSRIMPGHIDNTYAATSIVITTNAINATGDDTTANMAGTITATTVTTMTKTPKQP